MSSVAVSRLNEERKRWRKDHPPGFFARPTRNLDNSTNVLKWLVGIPGKVNTDWEGGLFNMTISFPDDYPNNVSRIERKFAMITYDIRHT
jgi:ubiquitin-conjugating enzyme E2 I